MLFLYFVARYTKLIAHCLGFLSVFDNLKVVKENCRVFWDEQTGKIIGWLVVLGLTAL